MNIKEMSIEESVRSTSATCGLVDCGEARTEILRRFKDLEAKVEAGQKAIEFFKNVKAIVQSMREPPVENLFKGFFKAIQTLVNEETK